MPQFTNDGDDVESPPDHRGCTKKKCAFNDPKCDMKPQPSRPLNQEEWDLLQRVFGKLP